MSAEKQKKSSQLLNAEVKRAFARVRSDYGSPEFFRGRRLEVIQLSEEQTVLLQTLNSAARDVLSSMAPGDYSDPKLFVLYRIVPSPDPDDYEEGPHSIHDGLLDAISIRDIDAMGDDGAIDNGTLARVYAHELAHHHGVTLTDRRTGEKVTGRGFWPDPESQNYRGIHWFDEAATTYLAANILFAARLYAQPEPQPEDWSDRSDEFRDSFNAMVTNLAKYLNYPDNEQLLQGLQTRLASVGFSLETIDSISIRRFLMFGRVNRQVHDELVSLLKTAYSQKSVDERDRRRYSSVWDKLQDDIGLFGFFGTGIQDLEL